MENPPFRILLIEDDPDDSMLLRTHLDDAGANADIVQITRLYDAAEIVETNEFDLVLLDLNLPDSRGLETLAQMLALVPNAPIIVMSGIAPPILLLLDLKMPKLDGRETLALIKSDPALKSLPVVVLTTSRADSDVKACYALGANSYICKPLTYEGLIGVMRTLSEYWLRTVTLV